jgi:hypothetical protein
MPAESGKAPDRDAAVPGRDDEREKGSELEQAQPPAPRQKVTAFKDSLRAAPTSAPERLGHANSLDSNRGAGMARERPLAKEESAPAIRFVCLLPPDGDTVEGLTRLLRREGARDIVVTALEPQAVRTSYAPHRERLRVQPEPSSGWTITARLPSGGLARLLDALKGRTRICMLEQQPPDTAPEAPALTQELHITVLK